MIEKLKIVHKILNHQEAIDFKKYTLIYGNNGVGKTTLTKCFKMLEKHNMSDLSSTDIFEINNTMFNSEENRNLFIRVFNGTDYISENITGSGKNKIGFILGEDSIKLEIERALIAQEMEPLNSQIVSCSKNKVDLLNELNKLKANERLKIAEYYKIDDRVKPTFEDLLDSEKEQLTNLTSKEIEQYKETIKLKSPLDLIYVDNILPGLKNIDIDGIEKLINTEFDINRLENSLNSLEIYLGQADTSFINNACSYLSLKMKIVARFV